jgi:hypothetical protein
VTRAALQAVIDTNVPVAAPRSRRGAAHRLFFDHWTKFAGGRIRNTMILSAA